MKPTFNRRFYLKSAAGVALALPFLELFQPKKAHGQTAASRLILCYTGQAMGADGDNDVSCFRPAQTGKLSAQQLPLSLQPLGGRELWPGMYRHPRHGDFVEPIRNWAGDVPDVRERVSVVTGLRIAHQSGTASADTYHHRGTVSPLLSGTSSTDASPTCHGATADVIAEQTFGSDPTIRCLVQAGNYGNGGRNDYIMSWRPNGNGGFDPVAAQVSPLALFKSLFEGFVPEGTGNDEEQIRAALRRRTVLDQILPAAQALNQRLGAEDQHRLQAHLDGLATLRDRLAGLDPSAGAVCQPPVAPGEDPPYAGGVGGDGGGFNEGQGWSGEEKRAEAFVDIVTAALACDLTRTATIMFSYTQSFLNGENPTGLRGDQHQIGHGGPVERANGSGNDSVALCHHYPVRYFGYLVGKLAAVQTAPGRSLLDDCAAALLFEAGHGEYEGFMNAHSGDEMGCLIAGGAGGLRQGEHIRVEGEHPGRVLSSLLSAVGCEAKLGDLQGTVPALFM